MNKMSGYIADATLRPDHGDASQDNRNLTLLKPEFFVVWALEGVQLSGEEATILQDI
jgi:hypothetical protein